MTYFIGLDFSVESTMVCVIDDAGRIEKELCVPTASMDLQAEDFVL